MLTIEKQYPCIEVNLPKLYSNISQIIGRCNAIGIDVAGVIKGCNALIPAARLFDESNCIALASSRLEHLAEAREAGLKGPFMAIRVSMISEVPQLVEYAEMSLQSAIEVIRAIDAYCGLHHKRHGVIMMADLGDLREGWWDKDEMVEAAVEIEGMKNVDLLGVGTNLGCYGAIVPTPENLGELISIAERIEARIGRRLGYISGGATTSLPLVLNGTMPKRINHLRLGEGILLGKDLIDLWNIEMDYMYTDVFTVKAEVIELRTKPTHPVGQIFVDCYGGEPEYEDRGMRKRALCALGKLDYVMPDMLVPNEPGIEVIGGSSDHLILDVEDYSGELAVGDVLSFGVRYATMMYLTASRYIKRVYIEE